MEGDGSVLETALSRGIKHSIYCCFFVDLQHKEELGSVTHIAFLQRKAFPGMWTELVNLLIVHWEIGGCINPNVASLLPFVAAVSFIL